MANKATTFRLNREAQTALAQLSKIRRRSMNVLVNEAVQGYLDQNLPKAEKELEESLAKLRAYRKADPSSTQAIDAFVDAEVTFPDGVEGRVVKEQPRDSAPAAPPRTKRRSHA